jgi:hypothetical protein
MVAGIPEKSRAARLDNRSTQARLQGQARQNGVTWVRAPHQGARLRFRRGRMGCGPGGLVQSRPARCRGSPLGRRGTPPRQLPRVLRAAARRGTSLRRGG